MNRKTLLALASAALVCLAAYAYSVAARPDMPKDTSLSFAMPQDMKEMLYYASLAPNAHNAQMWRVRYNPEQQQLTLLLDARRSLAKADPSKRESHISLGCFLENFRQAATALGYKAYITLEDGSQEDGVARIRLEAQQEPDGAKDTLLLMEKRRTDKRPLGAIPAALLPQLLDPAMPQLRYYPRGSKEFAYLSQVAVQSMARQAADQEKRDELAHWLRFSNEEAQASRDGLPAEQLGIYGIQKLLYYLFVSREKARGDNFAQQGVAMTADQTANCAGFFVISGHSSMPELVTTGMRLEQFWLRAAAYNVAIHPMSQILAEAPQRDAVTRELGLDAPAQMVLRAGIAPEYGTNNKIRRPLSRFVVTGE